MPAVTEAWGTDWPGHVVVLVPKSLEGMAALLGAPASGYRGIAAVTTGETGGTGTAPADRSSPADREWIANTAGVIDQLERDLQLQSSGGDTIAAARETLRGSLYTVLVAYTDFGGCRHMVAAAGDAASRFTEVTRTLAAACSLLQHIHCPADPALYQIRSRYHVTVHHMLAPIARRHQYRTLWRSSPTLT